MLRLADCDIVQGYFYAKPMPIGEFRTFLQEFNERDN
jgi:FOG: EAL domain